MTITERRICWPYPDKVCLEGGCGYCNDNNFLPLDQIQEYAEQENMLTAYWWGLERHFNNAETR